MIDKSTLYGYNVFIDEKQGDFMKQVLAIILTVFSTLMLAGFILILKNKEFNIIISRVYHGYSLEWNKKMLGFSLVFFILSVIGLVRESFLQNKKEKKEREDKVQKQQEKDTLQAQIAEMQQQLQQMKGQQPNDMQLNDIQLRLNEMEARMQSLAPKKQVQNNNAAAGTPTVVEVDLGTLSSLESSIWSIGGRWIVSFLISFLLSMGSVFIIYIWVSLAWFFIKLTHNYLIGIVVCVISMAALFDKISNMSGAVNLIATFALVFGCFIIDIINVIRYIRLKTKLKKMGITIS